MKSKKVCRIRWQIDHIPGRHIASCTCGADRYINGFSELALDLHPDHRTKELNRPERLNGYNNARRFYRELAIIVGLDDVIRLTRNGFTVVLMHPDLWKVVEPKVRAAFQKAYGFEDVRLGRW